jgi:NADH:ubiquinone oxidoreductase subunit 4 (subunit M)
MGQIAGIAALASFILAGIMLILAGFGLLHYRRVPAVVELLPTASSHAGVDPTDDTND